MNLKSIVLVLIVLAMAVPSIGFVMPFSEGPAPETGTRTYSHTVFAEDCTATWCTYCPAASEELNRLYEAGDRDFNFVCLIGDMNQEADDRISEYSIPGYPTVEFDGGYEEVVGGGSAVDDYAATLDACGARDVPDLGVDLQVTDKGDGALGVAAVVTNRGSSEYTGTLKAYVVEKVSRYLDYDGNAYPMGFIGFAIDEDFSAAGGAEHTTSATWDGSTKTDLLGNDYSDIDPDNILVIAVVFDSEGSRQIRSGVTTNKMYTAYFADACASAEPTTNVDAPQVKIVSPTNYQKVSGTVTIEAQVTSANDIDKVDVRIAERSWQAMTASGSTYTYDWDTTGESDGNYKIEIRATDVFSNEATRVVTAKVEQGTTEPPIEITNIRHSPNDPLSTDTVRISCEIFTTQGALDSVTIAICVGDTCDLPVDMVDEGGGTYSHQAGPYPAGSDVSYQITARDINSNTETTQKYHITVYSADDDDAVDDDTQDDDTQDDDTTDDDDVSGESSGFPMWAFLIVGVIVLIIIVAVIVFVVSRKGD